MLPHPTIPMERLFRIQLSTKAVSGLMPGGSAAGSALGYRLLTLSGVRPVDAGFALAGVGLVSAVVLNSLFFLGLFISIPLRGVNPFYGTAAAFGVGLMMFVAGLVVGIVRGESKAQGLVRWAAKKLHFDPDRAERGDSTWRSACACCSKIGDCSARRSGLAVVELAARCLAALWMFLLALWGGTLAPRRPDHGVLPGEHRLRGCRSPPGGLGIVEGIYIPHHLPRFGLTW